MRIVKEKALALIHTQLAHIEELRSGNIDDMNFRKWREETDSIISNIFGLQSVQFKKFKAIDYSPNVWWDGMPDDEYPKAFREGLDQISALLGAFYKEIQTFWNDAPQEKKSNALDILSVISDRFHLVVRQLRTRHDSRVTIDVSDEYDVQDLLHALLKLYFDDVRPEEATPSCAGASSRIDFCLDEHGVAIEVKKTRRTMKAKDLGDELLADIGRYQKYPNIKSLFCFVYDPEGLLPNPRGIERDLSRITQGIQVICAIRPK